MTPKLTFYYHDECMMCANLKPIILEFKDNLGIDLVNTYENELLVENLGIEFVPCLTIEDENGLHKFVGPQEIKNVLQEIVL